MLAYLLLLALLFPVGAQTPEVNSGGLVNFVAGTSSSSVSVAARGSLVSIFGRNFASQTVSASDVPFLTQLPGTGTQVLFGGVAAPLFLVSPTQINAQVPFEIPDMSSVDLVVKNENGVSPPVNVRLLIQDPAISAVVRLGSLVSRSNPIVAGDIISIYATGLGPVAPLVRSGQPGPSDPLALVFINPIVVVGDRIASVTFAGAVPGLVGTYLVNASVPLDLANPATNVQLLPGIVPSISGPPGPWGPQGPPGPPGAPGSTGPSGATGPGGPQGPAGSPGPQGWVGPPGAMGMAGAQGPPGPAGANGLSGLVWRGAWNVATPYAVNDGVQFNGTSYIAVQAGTGQQPDTSPTFWSVLAQEGGTGPAGATGPAGPQGPSGSAGPTGPQGVTGANGLTGPQGPTGASGPAGLTWRGTWNVATAYAVNDGVQFNGTSYIAVQTGTGQEPDLSLTFWSLLAEGVQSFTAVPHQWINAIASNGTPSAAQPAFSDLSGSVAPSQLPNPASTTLGGVKSQTSVTHQWINAISTSGQPSTSQPADSDLNVVDVTANNVSTSAHGFAPKAPNNTTQWLRGDATWANAPGRLNSFTVIATTGPSTYSLPANITAILIECVGGGGGGGGTAGGLLSAGAGGSGGAGSYARKYISSPAASYAIAVGSGGAGGAAGNNSGSSGNNTTFGSTIISCNGGSGGSGSPAGGASVALGGAGRKLIYRW